MKKSPSATDRNGNQGRFTPGISGNPQGRPKSETAVLRQSLADGATDVVTAILTAAKAGDMQACKIVIDRLVPSLKPTAATIKLAIPPEATPLEIAREILAATASGNLTSDIASRLITAIGTLCRIEEIDSLRKRISGLEKATTNNKQPTTKRDKRL
jgi:Family of unknown function (DUF5681)